MKLTPRYDAPGYVRFEGFQDDPSVPVVRQRRRLAETLAALDAADWAAPTRCEDWCVQDVVSHLVTTNRFWTVSVEAGKRGEPTRLLDGFDPVASPAEMAAADRGTPASEVLDQLVATNDAFAASLADLDADGWDTLAEAPSGHVPTRGVAYHALWDSWVHERDIVLPLGLDPVDEPDEIVASLTWAAALSPTFAVAYGSTEQGSVVVDTTDPDAHVVCDIADGICLHHGAPAAHDPLVLTGPAVELLEAISYRAPMRQPIAEEHGWLFSGLAMAFDRAS